MYDAYRFAVKTKAIAELPRIRADEWRHNWGPGFTADVLGMTGAAAELSELKTAQADYELKYRTAKARAAVPVGVPPPLCPVPTVPIRLDCGP